MQEILETLGHLGVVPVVKIERADEAVPLGNALIAGGLPCAEITFRTDAAEEAIRRIATELPQIVIGRGRFCQWNMPRSRWPPGPAILSHPDSTPR
jgi:2-dehydro-3-deoxyphosphogluconate aldolase/(4S)-4-hydroxy-2-oxoglutarate aldolase